MATDKANEIDDMVGSINECITQLETDVKLCVELEQSLAEPVARRIQQQHSVFLCNVRDRLKLIYDKHNK